MHRSKLHFIFAILFAFALSACAPVKAKKTETRSQKSVATEARKHYLQGVDAYTNDHYSAAIREWKQSLALVPHYQDAEDYIERAEHMQKAISKAKQAAKSTD